MGVGIGKMSYLFNMSYYSKKSRLLVVAVFVLSLSSCNIESVIFSSNKPIKKEISFKDGSTIKEGSTITVKFADLTGLKIKSSNSILEANLSDIKSFSAFLTTTPTDPFAIGSNPLGDGVVFSTNNINARIIQFFNVPQGGPYYAVITAFDGINGTGTNLSEPNTTIVSLDNKWNTSSDNVIVLPSRMVIFSNPNNSLNVDLILRKPVPNSITSEITVINGGDKGGLINVN